MHARARGDGGGREALSHGAHALAVGRGRRLAVWRNDCGLVVGTVWGLVRLGLEYHLALRISICEWWQLGGLQI